MKKDVQKQGCTCEVEQNSRTFRPSVTRMESPLSIWRICRLAVTHTHSTRTIFHVAHPLNHVPGGTSSARRLPFIRAVILSEAPQARSRRTRTNNVRAKPCASKALHTITIGKASHRHAIQPRKRRVSTQAANHRTRQLFSADWNKYTLKIAIKGSSG